MCSSTSLSCLTHCTFFIGIEKVGQAVLRCPAFWQQKHSPFSMQHFCLSGVSQVILTTSMSMASGLHTLDGAGCEKEWYVPLVGCLFLWAIFSTRSYCIWKWITFEYHSSTLEGMVSMDMMRFIKEGGILAEKYPIRTLWSVMVVRATLFWNIEMYSVSDGE